MAKTIAIDFDGVIHAYSKDWQNGDIYDEPITCVFEAIQDLMGEGFTVFIFSARRPRQIKKWLMPLIMVSEYYAYGLGDPNEYEYPRYGFTTQIIPFWTRFWDKKNVLGITRKKLPAAIYVDDRALKFEGDWMQTLDKIRGFKTYQE